MPGKRCTVLGCKGTSLQTSTFSFPQKPGVRQAWIQFIERGTKRGHVLVPKKDSVVCQRHFAADCFRQNLQGLNTKSGGFRLRLTSSAVPTLFPATTSNVDEDISLMEDVEIAEKQPFQTFSEYSSAKRAKTSHEEYASHISRGTMSSLTQSEDAVATKLSTQECGVQCELISAPPIIATTPSASTIEVVSDTDFEISDLESSEEEFDEYNDAVSTSTDTEKPHNERKYIVCKSSISELFQTCTMCGAHGQTPAFVELGTLVTVTVKCRNRDCGYLWEWASQPYIGSMPLGNLMLSGSILFSGSTISHTFHLLDSLNVAHFSKNTFYYHQTRYLWPVVFTSWQEEQAKQLEALQALEEGLVLAGDCRSDSPGHCAKFGAYSLLECRLNKVLDVRVIQSNEVGNANRCELEGLKRGLSFLEDKGMSIAVMITDRHRSIEKYLREEHAETSHYFDVWHVSKAVGKKMQALSKKRNMERIGEWEKSCTNHLHWTAASTPDGNGELMQQKWLSFLNHASNKHVGHGILFPECEHGELEEDDRNKDWFHTEDEDFMELCKIVENKSLLKDIKKLSPLHQTSALEAFHSLILRFCPKHTAFSYCGTTTRILLSALHYNENSDREILKDNEGEERFRVCFPKAKQGQYSVRRLKGEATYKYRSELMDSLLRLYAESPANLSSLLPEHMRNPPPPLASQYHHPTPEEARATYVTRYQRV